MWPNPLNCFGMQNSDSCFGVQLAANTKEMLFTKCLKNVEAIPLNTT